MNVQTPDAAVAVCRPVYSCHTRGDVTLVAGEEAGLELPFGCRMGICHTCVGKLCSGRLRDMRSGEVHGEEGTMVRTCVNAPEGPVEIEL